MRLVRNFEKQLQELLERVVLMGSLTEAMIQRAVAVLVTRSESPCMDVFAKEEEVNEMHVEVDNRAVSLTARQQPVAKDARFLFMASKIASDLERIADQSVNICQNAHYVLGSPPLKSLVELPAMAEIAQKMLRDSLTAMIKRDVSLANRVLEDEKKVDEFRDVIFKALLADLGESTGAVQRDISLILIARNLERIGDHATNIAEEVIYWIQGRDIRHGKAAIPRAS
jgi:phosphate transport system protein